MEKSRWFHIEQLIQRTGPSANEDFVPDTPQEPKILQKLHTSPLLVIGAGGLGCELLKNLCLLGFREIDVIDMDTIDVSNLNRQFLFRKENVGQAKATVAAEFINRRISGAHVTPHFNKIQDKPALFYKKFKVIICGLDSIEARRWVNSLIVGLVKMDEGNPDPDTIIPMIDGGTEGFKGHVRVIFPKLTSCFECMLDSFPPARNYPICTLASTPRLPEHCIEWASVLHWQKEKPFGDSSNPNQAAKIDTDNAAHIQWLFEAALKRATEHNIKGVTLRLTQGVVKNIIPAVASTNAIVAAACANEAFKIVTECSACLENFTMYNGTTSIYTHTFDYERKPDCIVCGVPEVVVRVPKSYTLQQLIEYMHTDENLRLSKPSLSTTERILYIQSPPNLEEITRPNLQKTLEELFGNCKSVDIDFTDPSLPTLSGILRVQFSEQKEKSGTDQDDEPME